MTSGIPPLFSPQQPLDDNTRALHESAARIRREQQQTTLSVFNAAAESGVKPDHAARVTNLARRMRVPRQQLPDDPAVLDRLERDQDLQTLLTRYPKLMTRFQDVPRVQMMVDDLGNFKTTAESFDWLARSWSAGTTTNEGGFLKAKAAFAGGFDKLSPIERDRLTEIDRLQMANSATEDGFLGTVLSPAVTLLGQMLEPMVASAGVGLASGPAAPVTSLATMFGYSATIEFGHQYEATYKALRDEGLDHETAHSAAMTTAMAHGIGAGALETASLKVFGKPFEGIAKSLAGRMAGKGLARTTSAQAGARALQQYFAATGTEIGTEGLQKGLGMLSELAAGRMTGADIGPDGLGEFLGGMGREMYEAAKGMALLGIPGPAMQYAVDVQRVHEAKQSKAFFQRLEKNATESKLRERDPQTYAEMITGVIKPEAPSSVYVPGAALMEGLERSGQTFEQLAVDLPEVAKQLKENKSPDDDVVIPMGDYAAFIAGEDLHKAIADDIRLTEDGYSNRTADEWMKERGENRATMQAKIAERSAEVLDWNEQAREVEDRIAVELAKDPRLKPEDAKLVALHYRAFVETQAAREKTTPREFDERNRLTFSVEGSGVLQQDEVLKTDTPEFRNWFGESKVVDEKGAPLVVYHGGTATESFDTSRGGDGSAMFGPGAYFGGQGVAEDFVEVRGEGAVTAAYLSLRNPYDERLPSDGGRPMAPESVEALKESLRKEGVGESDLDGLEKAGPGDLAYLAGVVAKKRGVPRWDAGAIVANAVRAAGFDGIVANYTGGSYQYVAFDPTQIKSVNNRGTYDPNDPNILRSDAPEGGAPRGEYDPASNTAYLLKKADLSTALHEMSHHFTKVMLQSARSPDASEVLRKDVGTLFDWWGIGTAEQTLEERYAVWDALGAAGQEPHWESFAYSYEGYLFDGRAPSRELEGVFRTFSRWIRQVYRNIRDVLNETYRRRFGRDLPFLTKEVRQVFDRMLASEDAIAEMKAQYAMDPLFRQKPEGMSDLDWAEYQLSGDEATESAIADLTRRSLGVLKWFGNAKGRMLKIIQKETRKLRQQIEDEERAAAESEPVYRARAAIQGGAVPKLRTDVTRELLKADLPNVDLRRDLTGLTSPDGIHPDELAELLGYSSGTALIDDLVSAQPLEDYVQDRADERMAAEHSDLADRKEMERQVDEVLHNEHRGRMVALELKFLSKVLTPVRTMLRAAKTYARETISAKRIGDIKPHSHVLAETRNRRAAEQALTKGNTAMAVQFKRKEMLEGQMTRAAIEAREEVDKARKLFQKLFRPDAKLAGTRDVDYIAIARALVAMFGMAPGKEKSAAAYIKDLQTYEPQLYEELQPMLARAEEWQNQEGREVRDFRDLTMDEFRDLADMVGALWHRSRRERQFELDGKKLELETVAAEVVEADAANPKKDPLPGALTKFEGKIDSLNSLLLTAARPENWAFRKDGAKAGGAFTKYFWRPIRSAVDRYLADRTKYTKRVAELVKQLRPHLKIGKIEFRDKAGSVRYVFGRGNGGFGQAELVAAMLHTGNESSLQKLLRGYGWGEFVGEGQDKILDTRVWDEFVADMVDKKILTKEIMDFVQAIWDLNEEIKPMAQRAHKEILGFRFKEIEPREVVMPGLGVWRGGYMPAKLARNARSVGRMQSLSEIEADYRKQFATTGRGFTKGRVEQFAEPLMLDLDLVPAHIDDVLRFSHLQPVVRDVQRLAQNRDVAESLNASQPQVWDKLLLPWLQRVASQSSTKAGKHEAVDRFWRTARSVSGQSLMFANLTNAVQQTLGLITAAVKVKPRYLAYGLWRVLGSPREVYREISGKSDFMDHRQKGQIYDSVERINDLMQNKSKFAKFQNWTQQHAYFLQTAFQNFMDAIIWQGAYEQAMKSAARDVDTDALELEAVRQADSAIRLTQGSFDPTDVAQYEEGTPFYKVWTQFSGWFNSMANLQRDQYIKMARAQGWEKAGIAFQAYILTFFVPMVGGELIAGMLRGHFDDDDEEGLAHEMFVESFLLGQLRSATAEVPVFGQGINAVWGWFDNKAWNDRMTSSPALSLLERAGKGTIDAVGRALDPDKVVGGKGVRDMSTLLNLWLRVPLAMPGRHLGALMDVGLSDPGSARALISGSVSERQRNENR